MFRLGVILANGKINTYSQENGNKASTTDNQPLITSEIHGFAPLFVFETVFLSVYSH